MTNHSFNQGANDASQNKPTGPQRPGESKNDFNDRSAGADWQRKQNQK